MCIFFCVPVFLVLHVIYYYYFFFFLCTFFFFFCCCCSVFFFLWWWCFFFLFVFFFHSTLTVVLSPARACLPFSFLFLISKSTEKQTTAKNTQTKRDRIKKEEKGRKRYLYIEVTLERHRLSFWAGVLYGSEWEVILRWLS